MANHTSMQNVPQSHVPRLISHSNFLKIQGELRRQVTYDIAYQIQLAVAAGARGSLDGLIALSKALGDNFSDSRAWAEAHHKIGARMQAAMLDAYDNEVGNQSKERSSPKRFKGQLRKKLADKRMVVTDAHGIEFINLSILRQSARHFARLNWGTQGTQVGPSTSPSFSLQLFGQEVTLIGFHATTRPAFQLPAGLFLGGVGSEAGGQGGAGQGWTFPSVSRIGTGVFHPLGELPSAGLRGRVAVRKAAGFFDHITRGIRPRYFLEAGLEEMTRALPAEYDSVMQDLLARSMTEGAGGAFVSNLKVSGKSTIKNPTVRSFRVTAGRQHG